MERDRIDRSDDPKIEGSERFFAQRRARADFKAFDRLMRRKGGEAPHADDKLK